MKFMSVERAHIFELFFSFFFSCLIRHSDSYVPPTLLTCTPRLELAFSYNVGLESVMFWSKGNMNLACVSIPEEVSSEAQWREVLQKHFRAGWSYLML